MSTERPQRSAVRRGSNVRELRPKSPPPAPSFTLEGPDMQYITAFVALVSVGMIMVYSTTAYTGGIKDLTRMARWLVVGVPAMIVAIKLPVSFWKKITPWMLVACFLMLASLLLKSKNPLAMEVNGAYRWLRVPFFGQLQPSEITKLFFVLFAARFLDRRGAKLNTSHWLAFLGVLGALAAVIYKEPDLGTALVFAGISFCMLIAAGARPATMVKGILILGTLVGLLAWNTPHQRDRLLAWWNPWSETYRQEGGYQVVQSFTAMSAGGLWGVGLGQSTHKLADRLPEAETDFIFAIVAEEMGTVGAVGVLLLFGLLAWRGYGIAARAPDRYTSLIVVGLTSWVAIQACMNIAVVTGTIPNTGIPLPFISSGGSSLTALMIATGIVIGISRMRRTAPLKEGVR